ncbi:MAG: hypothetical protein IPJ19_15205 [Planctomycetes bacterium]|nr:hypothetical protein [Planctomycetota bacterium]
MSTGNSPGSSAQTPRVSRWLGVEGEELTLSRARAALALCARMAGHPSWLWIAGIFYPALDLVPGGVWNMNLNLARHGEDPNAIAAQLALAVGMIALVFPVRLIVGLAAISTPHAGNLLEREARRPRLRDAWRAARGITLSGCALTLELWLMGCIGITLLVAPPFFFLKGLELDPESGMFAALLAPFVGVFLVFLALVSVIYQLALSSLAHNRRGSSSALTHGWRIARHRPWATLRAALVDLVLWAMQRVLMIASGFALLATCVGAPFIPVALLGVLGFVGVTRASYWARMYRELGGLSPEDGVPGLGAGQPEAA